MSFIKKVFSSLGLIKTDPKVLLSESKVFCMAPWVQLHAQTNGKMAPCCMASMYGGNEIGDLREDSDLRNAWNSQKMKQLRLNMVEGRESTLCQNCYSYEKHGKFSERMQYNQDFKHYYKRVTDMLRDGTVGEDKIPIIDIRFSNKCNYKCRICNSEFSSMWYEEELQAGTLDPGSAKEIKAASDERLFWESFKSLLPYTERLHFAGGEPLFMDEHYEVLEHLISIGKTDLHLTYNTNLSTLRYKRYNVIDLWNKFQRVDIWASLDGMGAQGDYHRKGQKWKDIEENIRLLQRDCPSVLFGVNVAVSIFNILHIPDFYRYMVENNFVQPDRMNLYIVFGPGQFSVTNLPQSVKDKAVKQFEDFENGYLSTLADPSRIKQHIKAVVAYMQSDDRRQGQKLVESIRTIDKIRNEDFDSTFPELAEIMTS